MPRLYARSIHSFVAVVILTIFCAGCSSSIQTRSLSKPNPTSYVFPIPLQEVRSKALQAFSIEHLVEHPIFGLPTNAMNLETTLFVECSTNAVFSEAIFRNPANSNDIYLHTFDMPFVKSSVYFGHDGGLPFIATFHLHLTAEGSNTFVTVITSDAKVVNGRRFGIGPCGFGYGSASQKVKPTTVEEYSILRYLGQYLSVTNMPDVILPKS